KPRILGQRLGQDDRVAGNSWGHLMARQLKLFAILTSLAAGPCTAMAQSAAVNLDGVVIVQEFIANGDAGQCNGRAYGAILSQAASWSPAIFIDTDSRPGGCFYR